MHILCVYIYIYIYMAVRRASSAAALTSRGAAAPPSAASGYSILYYIILYYAILYYIRLYYIIYSKRWSEPKRAWSRCGAVPPNEWSVCSAADHAASFSTESFRFKEGVFTLYVVRSIVVCECTPLRAHICGTPTMCCSSSDGIDPIRRREASWSCLPALVDACIYADGGVSPARQPDPPALTREPCPLRKLVECGWDPRRDVPAPNMFSTEPDALAGKGGYSFIKFEISNSTGSTVFYIPQRGVQWKQGVVVYIILWAVLLYNTTPVHCTPHPLHPPLRVSKYSANFSPLEPRMEPPSTVRFPFCQFS